MIVFIFPICTEAADLSSKAGTVKVSSGWLNVRNTPSTTGQKVASLQKGSYITLISKSGSWWKVEYAAGKYGYCHADYINEISSKAVTVTTKSGALNIRSGPDTSYAKTGSLSKGATVVILSTSGGWSKVLFAGVKTGYVSAEYLSNYYRAVSNYAPNLKQMDSRWGDLEIATSGKTFSQIGCATTAIAMVESHRRGSTVYPNDMARELRYTPTGSVYWPSDYVAVTENTGFLKKIYDLLQKGKVVLFGARNNYGTQHYVVINGFTGGTELTASKFMILDPGTYSRTQLQQFMDVYPVFYKYFYY